MLQNNLDAEVAENPAELVVYGGIGRAARDWESYDAILESLRNLGDDETLLVQSGKPVGIFPTHRSDEHTSELQSLMRTSYAVFCLKKKKLKIHHKKIHLN